jgi:hypothetical protein
MQGTQEYMKRQVENVRNIQVVENKLKATSSMRRKHLKNLINAMKEREIYESMQRTRPKQKVVSLMFKKHLISLVEDVKEKGLMRIDINSLVISWLGMRVARVLRINASKPMVGWKDEHP